MILDGTIVNGDINASAAIAHSKLANITAGSVLLGNATNVPTATALTGDVTVNSSGVTAISSGVIVNADVNASAAIAGTKISPDFGSQTITTTGVVSAALGAAATPSISFTGDLNTGIYSPGADQVAISTNGAGRLFVDASGGISIGASSTPGALLGVTRGAASLLDLHRTGVAGEARLNFYNDNSASAATVAGRIAGLLTTTTAGSESGALLFVTNNSGTVGERARITAEGRLGLGTSSPAELLHVSGGNIRFGSTGFIGEDSSVSPALISIGVNPGSTYTVTRDIQFLANPNNASSSVLMTIKGQTGRVGIGTTTPSSTLHVYESSGNNKLELQSASLANTEQASFSATGGARSQAYGIYKHSGITNPCGYVGLTCEDAAQNFLWADNSDQLRISTNAGHIGTTSGTVIGTQTSDERVKNILGPVEYGLEILKQIEPVRYSLKSQPDIEQLGFIAQQVQPLVPQSVFDTKEHIEGEPEDAPTKLGMEYVALIPVLVNAIKELSAEVDALKAQLQAS
jgi:hypothetical protein